MLNIKQVCSRRSVQLHAAYVNQIRLFTGVAPCCGCPDQSSRVYLLCLTLLNSLATLSRDTVILQRNFSTLLHQWRLAS